MSRSIGRSILLFLIVVAITAAAAVALSIRSTAAQVADDSASQLSVTATIDIDRQNLMQQAQSQQDEPVARESYRDQFSMLQSLPLDTLLEYATSAHVSEFRYSATLSLNTTDDIEAVGSEETTQATQLNESGLEMGGVLSGGGGGAGGPWSFAGVSLGDLSVVGYASESAMTSFVSGQQKIISGAMIDLTQANNEALVSSEFAVYNSLEVGDSLVLANPAATDQTYTFTIVGIYDAGASSTTESLRFSTSQDPANQIIISYPTLSAVEDESSTTATTSTDIRGQSISTALSSTLTHTFVFESPNEYQEFDTQLRAAGLDATYALTSTDLEAYNSSLIPLENLSNFAGKMLLIVLGVGALVFAVVSVFNTRERKYEIGVMTAIGISKLKVVLQFLAEAATVTLLGLLAGLGIGMVAAVPVAETLLANQVSAAQAQQTSVETNFGRPGGGAPMLGGTATLPGLGNTSAVSYIDQINARVDFDVAGQLGAIGLGLALLSSGFGAAFVMRYEPLNILAERS
ncbi:MAG: ABC transporter permease [Propionibacteriaceae bacterium]|nr:ABC transporter permease [Propionibacteriaceae bacterium]